jgi:hypothetical protein
MACTLVDLGAVWTVHEVTARMPNTPLAAHVQRMLAAGASAAEIRAEVHRYAAELADAGQEPQGAA